MPSALVKAAAKQTGSSVGKNERIWDQGKKSAKKAGLKPGSEQFYKYITSIFMKRTGYKPKQEQLEAVIGEVEYDPTLAGYDLFKDIGEATFRAISHELYSNLELIPQMVSSGLLSGIEEAVDLPSNLSPEQKAKVKKWMLRSVSRQLNLLSRI